MTTATHLVEHLKTSVVTESLESSPVRLPEELEPWGNDSAIGPVLGDFAGDG